MQLRELRAHPSLWERTQQGPQGTRTAQGMHEVRGTQGTHTAQGTLGTHTPLIVGPGLHIARRVAHTRYLTTQGRVRGIKVKRDYNYADAGTHYLAKPVAAVFDKAFRGK